MDFIVRLHECLMYNTIFVVANMLTKMTHSMPVWKDNFAKDIVTIFIKNVFIHHGLPCTIISDRDSKFTSFWKALFEAISTHLIFSTTYHPQIDDQKNRINQVIEDML